MIVDNLFSQEFEADKNKTIIECPELECSCYKSRLLCGEGGSLDLTEWFTSEDGPHGPGKFICDESIGSNGITRNCLFTEDNMNQLISQFFGDSYITLSCPLGGECMHYTEVPGYERPEFKQGFSLEVILLLSASCLGLLGVVFGSLVCIKKRSESSGQYVAVGSGENFRTEEEMMAHHLPCTIMFRNTSYIIDTNLKVSQELLDNNDTDSDNSESIGMAPRNQGNHLLSKPRQKQVVLEGIQGIVRPGQVMAIMGGSGAGKTTLLDILARKNKSGVVSGDILINGSFMNYGHYRDIIGYVDQEDSLMETLTVYETILNSAMLRLPKTMSLETKKGRVQETMAELGILHIANKRIGSAGNRGLSGGEKRRVSIACELVTSPSILFLDEPTSGLDSYNAYNVIECLVGLARDYQRSVIFTIHQPRSNIYALFDQLVLLSKGRIVYSGPAQQEVIDHFADLGYNCPLGFNIADYLVDLTMHAANSTKNSTEENDVVVEATPSLQSPFSATRSNIREQQESLLYSPKNPHVGEINNSNSNFSINATQEPRPTTPGPNPQTVSDGLFVKPYLTEETLELINGYSNSQISKDIQETIERQLLQAYPNYTASELENVRRRNRHGPSLNLSSRSIFSHFTSFLENQFSPGQTYNRAGANLWDQFKILSWRTFINLYRNPDLLRTQYAISVIAAVSCGLLFWKLDNTLAGFQNRLGVMFFISALFGFACLSSMQAFASERLIFIRERANRYYSPLMYFVSKVFFDLLPLRVIPPVILGLICYHMIGLQPEPDVLLRFLLVLVIFNVTSASCCLAISIIFEDQAVASLIATLIMLFEMLFGGLLLNKATISPAFQWLYSISFFNYAFEALIVNEVAGLTLVEEKFGFKVPGALVLQTFGLNAQGYWGDVKNLGIMGGAFLGVAFLWLQLFVKERR
ncbi:hypothetical protein HK103_005817 [Boothiomyces macroporosus]|uniref:ABC transporter domain-containing protein n=1 Tax=Boothiomyces macroporosus TaxID=261099 RepID=A0AAD5UEM5_9FUNG|nr:hypothetical protein HK103_005817 [Boothiomyces macroporosus]